MGESLYFFEPIIRREGTVFGMMAPLFLAQHMWSGNLLKCNVEATKCSNKGCRVQQNQLVDIIPLASVKVVKVSIEQCSPCIVLSAQLPLVPQFLFRLLEKSTR